MKNILKKSVNFAWINMAVLLVVSSAMAPKQSVAEVIPTGISFQVFYDELSPYGDWIMDPTYGYVWVPYAERGFQPYASNGYWVMTNYGNTWVSNYDWGWAPFHYGRWYFDDYLGWAWVPGYEWGPAWVNWRTGGDYYGWAPLMPGFSIQVAVNIPTNYWVFVPKRRFVSRNIYNYYVPRRNVYKIYNQTTVINNTYVYNNNTYVSGPARRDVERVTRRSVPVYQVRTSDKPGRTSVGSDNLQVYQPAMRRTADSEERQARPARVYTANEHKANVISRSSASTSSRTAPANSRANTNNSRTTEVISREQRNTRQEATRTQNPVRSERQTQVQRPARSQSSASSAPQRTTQPTSVTRPQSNRQSPAKVGSRTTQAPQQRSREQAAPANSVVQSPRQSAPRSQEVGRGSSNTRVAPANTSERSRSSGTTTGTSTQSRGSSRGNN